MIMASSGPAALEQSFTNSSAARSSSGGGIMLLLWFVLSCSFWSLGNAFTTTTARTVARFPHTMPKPVITTIATTTTSLGFQASSPQEEEMVQAAQKDLAQQKKKKKQEEWQENEKVERMATFLSSRLGMAFIKAQQQQKSSTTSSSNVVQQQQQETLTPKMNQEDTVDESKETTTTIIKDDKKKALQQAESEGPALTATFLENNLESIMERAAEKAANDKDLETSLNEAATDLALSKEEEVSVLMHQKEGDRVVTLKDEFGTGRANSNNNAEESSPAISLSFGKPLEVIQSGVPPLSKPISNHNSSSTNNNNVSSSSSLKATSVSVEEDIDATTRQGTTMQEPDQSPPPLLVDGDVVALSLGQGMQETKEEHEPTTLSEKAFAILLDLKMIQITPDPRDPNYDHSNDDELCPENVWIR